MGLFNFDMDRDAVLCASSLLSVQERSGNFEPLRHWSELGSQFNKEVISHLPLVSSLHNIMRTRRLHQLKFGTNKFKMSNHKEVEGILSAAGSTSEGESNFEAGPQAVTQV